MVFGPTPALNAMMHLQLLAQVEVLQQRMVGGVGGDDTLLVVVGAQGGDGSAASPNKNRDICEVGRRPGQ